MSGDAAMNAGIDSSSGVACVGDTADAFKDCVLAVHEKREYWQSLRDNGLDFAQKEFGRAEVTERWKAILGEARESLLKQANHEEKKEKKEKHHRSEGL